MQYYNDHLEGLSHEVRTTSAAVTRREAVIAGLASLAFQAGRGDELVLLDGWVVKRSEVLNSALDPSALILQL